MRGVNLVPARARQRQARHARLQAWIGVNAVLAALTCGLCVHQWASLRSAARVDAQACGQLELDAAELTRRLLAATQQHARLVELARQVIELEEPHPLAERLIGLFESTPETVALTSLSLQRVDAARLKATTPAPAGDAPAPPGRPAPAPERPAEAVAFELRGYSLDFETLQVLIDACEARIQPLRSELRDTSLTPLLDGQAVSFHYDFAVGDRP
jgi:hypothetical protein